MPCCRSKAKASHQFRILRAVKNRFGPTDEIGVFEMTGRRPARGREPIRAVPLRARPRLARHRGVRRHGGHAAPAGRDPGAGRADLARHAAPRRGRLGPEPAVDGARRAGGALRRAARRHDVYLNVAGGLRIQEPAADLAAAAALVSSLAGAPLPAERVYFGEIVAVGRGAAGGAGRRPAEGGRKARLCAAPSFPRSRLGSAGDGHRLPLETAGDVSRASWPDRGQRKTPRQRTAPRTPR